MWNINELIGMLVQGEDMIIESSVEGISIKFETKHAKTQGLSFFSNQALCFKQFSFIVQCYHKS